MSHTQEFAGFFSVVRYVPDEWRGEGVNLGVVLLCPKLRELRWQFNSNHQRARRFFQTEQDLDVGRLKVMKAGLVERLQVERGNLLTRERLDGFVKLFRNQVQLTEPRSCLVTQPEKDLQRLYARLVEGVPEEAAAEERSVMTLQQLRLAFVKRLHEKQL